MSIPFNILFTYVLLKKDTSFHAIIACTIVLAGFFIGAYGEINFSWEGIIYGVGLIFFYVSKKRKLRIVSYLTLFSLGSSCFVALYGIYVKKKLAILDNNEWLPLNFNSI